MPGRACTVCTHPDAVEINEALFLEGKSNRATAAQYGVSREAIRRHREHVPQLLVEARENMDVYNAASILSRIESLERETLAQLEGAKEDGDRRVTLSAIREQRQNIELVARLLGELNEGTTINLVNAPQWLQVRALVVAALEPHPEARRAVVEALEGVDGG